MDPDTLQSMIDARLEESEDAKRLGIVSVKVGKGSEDIDLASNVPIDVTISNQPPRNFIVYSVDIIDRFLEETSIHPAGPSRPMGVFFSTTPMVIVKSVTPQGVLQGVVSYLEVEKNTQLASRSKPRRWPFGKH